MADRIHTCGNCDHKWWREVWTVKLPVDGPYNERGMPGRPNREVIFGANPERHRAIKRRLSYVCDNCGQALAETIREADDEPRQAGAVKEGAK